MEQDELIAARRAERDAYTALVMHDTDLYGANSLRVNPAGEEEPEIIDIELAAMFPTVREQG